MDRTTPEPAEEPRPEFVVGFARFVVFDDVYGYQDGGDDDGVVLFGHTSTLPSEHLRYDDEAYDRTTYDDVFHAQKEDAVPHPQIGAGSSTLLLTIGSDYIVATNESGLPTTTTRPATTATVDDSKFFEPVLSLVLYSAGSAAACT